MDIIDAFEGLLEACWGVQIVTIKSRSAKAAGNTMKLSRSAGILHARKAAGMA